MSNKSKVFKRITEYPVLPIIIMTALLIVINEVFFNSIFTGTFIKSFFRSNTPMIFVGIGTAIIIMGGGMDISLGALLSLINVIIVQLNMGGMNLWVASLIGIAVGIAAGAFNGFFVGILRVTPMIATFASMSIFNGLALWIQPVAGGNITTELKEVYKAMFLGIPVPVWLVLIALAITYLIFRSPLGTAIMAAGYAPEKTFASGKNVYMVQFFTFIFAGFLTAIGSICITASIASGNPTLGQAYSMNCIAAGVIGGVSLTGGKGKSLGAVVGTIFLALITNIIVSANIDSFYQDLIKGLIMFIALVGASLLYVNKTVKKQPAKAKNSIGKIANDHTLGDQ